MSDYDGYGNGYGYGYGYGNGYGNGGGYCYGYGDGDGYGGGYCYGGSKPATPDLTPALVLMPVPDPLVVACQSYIQLQF